MSNGIESNWVSRHGCDGLQVNSEARRIFLEQIQPERVRPISDTQQDKSSEAAQVRKDAEDIARCNPPDQAALDALALHLYEAYQSPGNDNWSGQVEYAKKVNEELKKIGSKFQIVINSSTRAFKDEVGPGEVGFFSIVDTDGKVIVARIKY